jgi:acetyltransferase-like isoleucine patch superfamily enzyme
MPLRPGIIIEGECDLTSDLDTGHYVVLRSCKIGSGVGIWNHCVVDPGVVIGNNVRIQSHVYISSGTVIEDDVFVGPGTIFLNDKYPPQYDKQDWEPPIVRKGAVIGGGVAICPGVEVGEGAKIGAGAVVTKSVPAGETWVGLPASEFDRDGKKLAGAITDRFELDMLEATGYLVLMIHNLRGLLSMAGDKLQLTEAESANWKNTVDSIEAYEEFAWSVAPPRAMLSQLRAFRKVGYLDEHFAKLLDGDAHGRMGVNQGKVPEDLSKLVLGLNKIARESDG